jgi:phytanoyl-CoA hydroxylase
MTNPISPITDEMLDSYWKNGFVVVPGLVAQADLDRYMERLSEIVEGHVPPAEGMLVMKDVMVAKGAVEPGTKMEATAKIQDYEKDPVLDAYTRDDGVLDCVERIVGHDVQTIHTMLINKPPNVDGRHPLHQDLLYFPFRPADKIVASWTALERVTKENGCLVAIPGSHLGELLEHENPDWEYLNGGYFGAKDVPTESRVHLEMEPGDTVFFHPILLHGSGRNRTQGFRRAISAHYTSLDVEWAWTIDQTFNNRKYRIVRGERAGEFWEGPRRAGGSVEPLDYIPGGKAIKKLREEREEKERREGK